MHISNTTPSNAPIKYACHQECKGKNVTSPMSIISLSMSMYIVSRPCPPSISSQCPVHENDLPVHVHELYLLDLSMKIISMCIEFSETAISEPNSTYLSVWNLQMHLIGGELRLIIGHLWIIGLIINLITN